MATIRTSPGEGRRIDLASEMRELTQTSEIAKKLYETVRKASEDRVNNTLAKRGLRLEGDLATRKFRLIRSGMRESHERDLVHWDPSVDEVAPPPDQQAAGPSRGIEPQKTTLPENTAENRRDRIGSNEETQRPRRDAFGHPFDTMPKEDLSGLIAPMPFTPTQTSRTRPWQPIQQANGPPTASLAITTPVATMTTTSTVTTMAHHSSPRFTSLEEARRNIMENRPARSNAYVGNWPLIQFDQPGGSNQANERNDDVPRENEAETRMNQNAIEIAGEDLISESLAGINIHKRSQHELSAWDDQHMQFAPMQNEPRGRPLYPAWSGIRPRNLMQLEIPRDGENRASERIKEVQYEENKYGESTRRTDAPPGKEDPEKEKQPSKRGTEKHRSTRKERSHRSRRHRDESSSDSEYSDSESGSSTRSSEDSLSSSDEEDTGFLNICTSEDKQRHRKKRTHRRERKTQPSKAFRHWKKLFSGGEDSNPAEYLDELELCQTYERLEDDEVLDGLYLTFKDEAKLWYRNEHKSIKSLKHFKSMFRRRFMKPITHDDLEEDLKGRKQGEDENIDSFIAAIKRIVSEFRRPPLLRTQIRIAYKNLKPDYRRFMVRQRLKRLDDITHYGRQHEKLLAWDKNNEPQRPAHKMAVPSAGYEPKKKSTGNVAATNEEGGETPPPVDTSPKKGKGKSKKKSKSKSQAEIAAAAEQGKGPQQAKQQQQGLLTQPQFQRVENLQIPWWQPGPYSPMTAAQDAGMTPWGGPPQGLAFTNQAIPGPAFASQYPQG